VEASPRSWLFVPADNGSRIGKALASAADVVVIDLEDAVEARRRPVAREELASILSGAPARDPRTVWVRVNPDIEELRRDLDVVIDPRIGGLIIPKVREADDVATARGLIDQLGGSMLRLVAMIETARSVLRLPEIADSGLLDLLMMGEQDLGADLGLAMGAQVEVLNSIRMSTVVACAAAGLPGPVASPFMAVRDVEGLGAVASGLASSGFSGMAAIHPAQIDPINRAFSPSEDEVRRAVEVVAAFDSYRSGGVGVYADQDGNMIDEAVVRRARQVLRRSRTEGG